MNEELERIVVQELDSLEFDLVEFRRGGTKSRPLVEVRIDRRDGQKVTVDDCARVSRAIEARFDTSGLLSDRYVLQVSSPGERPLRTAGEWRRFVGRWASVLSPAHGGRFEAKIVAVSDVGGGEAVELELDSGEHRTVPLGEVKEARLAFRV
ncbi:MAG: ribosome maturation factor RimP [Gemmatimonadota bacterium]|nr:ribosome maturation factor RimP [Gemmatimonadota bacterium]